MVRNLAVPGSNPGQPMVIHRAVQRYGVCDTACVMVLHAFNSIGKEYKAYSRFKASFCRDIANMCKNVREEIYTHPLICIIISKPKDANC